MALELDQVDPHLIDHLAKLGENLDVAGDVALDPLEGQPDSSEPLVELPTQLGEQ
jgi:hypothetical protein